MQLDLISNPQPRRLSRSEARARRDLGMQRVGDKAERTAPGWTDIVLGRVRVFVRAQAGYFTTEQMRSVLAAEVPPPHDLRAWGVVTKLSLERGLIDHTGRSAPAASSNMSDKPLFKRGATA